MAKKIKLTEHEQERFKEMVELFGGEGSVDKSKIRRRVLSTRKRKTNRVTSRDMEDMFGY